MVVVSLCFGMLLHFISHPIPSAHGACPKPLPLYVASFDSASVPCFTPPLPASLHLPLLLSTGMAGRALRLTPSTTGDLSPWQLTFIDNLSQLHSECFENRTALTHIIQEFPALQGVAALDEITYAVQIGWNVGADIAAERAKEILQPGEPNFQGTRPTSPPKLVLHR